MSGVQEFQKFLSNDAQLKSFGNCVNQVNLFGLNNSKSNFQQRPNRVALVLVSIVLAVE